MDPKLTMGIPGRKLQAKAWTLDEHCRFLEAVRRYGSNFKQIQ